MLRYFFPRYSTRWTFLNYIIHSIVVGVLAVGGLLIYMVASQLHLIEGHPKWFAFFASLFLLSFVVVIREKYMLLGCLIDGRPWARHILTLLCALLVFAFFTHVFFGPIPPPPPQ